MKNFNFNLSRIILKNSYLPCFFILLISVLISSCETNPPNTPENIIEYGKVFITSNIDGAEIFIDDITTSKFSPDTIVTKTGNHIVTLKKEGYFPQSKSIEIKPDIIQTLEFILEEQTINKVVLLEDFSNVSCTPCVASNKIIHSIQKYTYGISKLVVIKYPAGSPSPNDPMYLAAKNYCDTRAGFYNVLGTPHMRIDGCFHNKPSDSISIKQKIDGRLLLTPPFEINIAQQVSGNNLIVGISIDVIDLAGLDLSDFVLHTVLIEEEINYTTPPGSNGETVFYDVMRQMMPSADGESLANMNQPGQYTFNRNVSLNPEWDKSKLKVIAFVQSLESKEIIQSAITTNF